MAFQKPSRCEQATPNNRTHNSTANYVNLALAKDVILTGFKKSKQLACGQKYSKHIPFFLSKPPCSRLPFTPISAHRHQAGGEQADRSTELTFCYILFVLLLLAEAMAKGHFKLLH